jgi:branched-chain amino acid aminotransferase
MAKYIWQNGKMKPFEDATTHVASHGLHYGSGVFEGIRAYNLNDGNTAILCLSEHTDRLYYSALALGMQIPYSKEELNQAILDTIKINQLSSCYIRPLVYYGQAPTGLKVCPAENTPVEVVVYCYDMGNYLPDVPLDVIISDFIRIHPKSTNVAAKICGHYINSMQALMSIRNTKYSEVILLDHEGNVAEGSAENIFVIKDKVIYTPELGTILTGITRGLVIALASRLGYKVVEGTITPSELFVADEIFMTGTAVEVRGLASVNDKPIGDGLEGVITKQIKSEYKKICTGQNAQYRDLLTVVC